MNGETARADGPVADVPSMQRLEPAVSGPSAIADGVAADVEAGAAAVGHFIYAL